jgi:hypothetical protein
MGEFGWILWWNWWYEVDAGVKIWGSVGRKAEN